MAAEAKEGGVKVHHVKSSSAPATLRRPGSAPSGRQTVGSDQNPDHHASSAEHEKPMPSYLRPTISSCRNSTSQAIPAAGRSSSSQTAHHHEGTRRKSPSSSSSSSQVLKERPSSKPSSSPLPKQSINSSKAAAAAKDGKAPILSKSQSFSRATLVTAKRREEKAVGASTGTRPTPALLKSKSFSRGAAASGGGATKRRLEAKQDESTVAEEGEKITSSTAGDGEGQQACDEVIEETASKVEERRDKVLALVGAFETVMSLQEPAEEGQVVISETKVDEAIVLLNEIREREEEEGIDIDAGTEKEEEEEAEGDEEEEEEASQLEEEEEEHADDNVMGQESQQKEECGVALGQHQQQQQQQEVDVESNGTVELTKSEEESNGTVELTKSADEEESKATELEEKNNATAEEEKKR